MTRQRHADNLDWQAIEARLAQALAEATPQQFADGLAWYSQARDIARECADATFPPIDTDAAAGVIAALSPQANWSTNCAQARAICNGEAIANTISRIGKATEILQGTDPNAVLNGPKERAFWKSIADPIGNREACIDRHMVRAALDVESDREIRLWIGRAGIYDGIAECIARCADQIGIPVPAAQAIIWNVVRDPRQGINR